MADLKIWVLTYNEHYYGADWDLGYYQSLESAQAAAVTSMGEQEKFHYTDYEDSYEARQVKETLGVPSAETPVYDTERVRWVARRFRNLNEKEWRTDPSVQSLYIANLHERRYDPTGYKVQQCLVSP